MSLQEILNKKFNQLGIGKSITAALVCEKFEELSVGILGEVIAQETKAVSFKDHIITVQTSSPVIAQEIKLHEQDILEAVNEKLGEGVVRGMKFMG